MPRFTVKKGKLYRATIKLGLVQSVASNDMVAAKFREVGFTDVTVTGSGRNRLATGAWPHADQAADIPDEIDHIDEIRQIEV